MQSGEGPAEESAGLPPGTKQVPRGCPEAGPEGPDADHQAQGTKTARPEPPHPGQEDVRLKDENKDLDERTAISAEPLMLCSRFNALRCSLFEE